MRMPGFSYEGSTDNKFMYTDNGKEYEDEN